VVKVAPGGKAEQFVAPGAAASRSILGVLADEKGGTLYVCSNDMSNLGVAGPTATKGAQLKTFDLYTGAPKGSFAFGDAKSMCNDIAVGPDGAAYATDSFTPNVYRLNPGGTAFEVWATDPLLAPAKDGVGLDGIAFGPDGNLYVTTFIPAALLEISVMDGKPGTGHRVWSGRQSLRHDVYPGCLVRDIRDGRQARHRHRAEGFPRARPDGWDACIR
jgi:sugar lactone lactonase YvrE